MTAIPIDLEAERILRRAAHALTSVRPGECVTCYVARMLDDFGCDTTLRFARSYRDRHAPRATGLERRLGQAGGFCDCEIFLNGWSPHPRFWTPRREFEEDGIVMQSDPEPPNPLPPCAGVRRGSTRPCANWVRHTFGYVGC